MSERVKTRQKLIEVALPLDAINEASAREKSIRQGHPSTLHLWWARRPLAAARAVIFSQMVDDPSEYVDELLAVPENVRRAEEELERRRVEWAEVKALYDQALRDGNTSVVAPGTEATLRGCAADLERQRLFDIVKQLVLWANSTNESVLNSAREEIWKSWRRACADNKDHPRASALFNPEKLPAFHDPFAGGGALPLEAQRLGLEAHAGDLNPVAVLISKAMIEIPPKFAGRPPVNAEAREQREMEHKEWHGVQGLAEDVRYYGKWMRNEAEERLGHLYPKVRITEEIAKDRPDLRPLVGRELVVIAWLWARTVKSPNPAFAHVDVPLVSNFILSTKPGKEAYVEPVIENDGYRFTVRFGQPKDVDAASNGTKLSRGNFRCLFSDVPIPYEYIDAEANADRMRMRLMAIVAEGERRRVYLSPTPEMEEIAREAKPTWQPDAPSRGTWASNAQGRRYGFRTFGDYFTPRQLVALTTFSDLVQEAREQVKRDALEATVPDDGKSLASGGTQASAYADAVALYLAFAVDRLAMTGNTLVRWNNVGEKAQHCFGRQAIPMMWDFAEPNFLATATGSLDAAVFYSYDPLNWIQPLANGWSKQEDASTQSTSDGKVVSSDPPYYDNVGYADLSDFFYVWLRRSLKNVLPDLFATVAVPKAEELIACSYRHGSKEKAEAFFLSGMTKAIHRLAAQSHPGFPVTIYYAFKQSETESDAGNASTGWQTFLDALIRAGFALSGTWPIRTEMRTRQIAMGTNALASSIVLVCRPSVANAPIATRRELVNALKSELPGALAHLQHGNIAPVDLAQAAIGPGMAVYTRYSKVLDAEGKPLSVRDALALINETLDEVLAEQEGSFDADTRWALSWFEQVGFDAGEYGVAEMLSKAKNTSVQGMKDAGLLDRKSPGGKVRLLRPSELPADWDPLRDRRLTVWEVVHQLVRRLESGGESSAAELVEVLGGVAEVARELAYRLYTICERKKRAPEALSYNALVQSWPEIIRLSREQRAPQVAQAQMFQ